MNPYLTIAAIFAAFLMSFLTYRKGLQDGLAINKGKDIKPMQNPVTATYKAVTEIKETAEMKKEEKEMAEQISNLMNYDGNPQKKRSED